MVVMRSSCPPRIHPSAEVGRVLSELFDPMRGVRQMSLRCVAVPGLPSLIRPPIAFGHRGARAHAPENTLESFQLALRLGATGLESDVWLTSEGVAVLDPDGVVKSGLRKRAVSDVARSALPAHVPTLEDLYTGCGNGFDL